MSARRAGRTAATAGEPHRTVAFNGNPIVPGESAPLGASASARGVNFSVFSKDADLVELEGLKPWPLSFALWAGAAGRSAARLARAQRPPERGAGRVLPPREVRERGRPRRVRAIDGTHAGRGLSGSHSGRTR
jgi:hypothetical protein